MSPEQQNHKQALFRRVFGEKIVAFDPVAVAKAKSLPPGERLKLDTNGDGKVDTIYFIDNDPKHEPQFRPILVKVIDQDGDMDRDGDGDLDSDLYVADWHADGTVDAVIEYKDTDGDNGLDEMGIYTYSAKNARLGTDAIQVWWSRDVAGTHQLWDTINYRYQQKECQFRTAFGGDEIFSSYIFDSQNSKWIPSWENPFAFYDEDRDGLAEVAIRFSGSGDRMESMRYSFDADNDTDGYNVHDYDFSFSCLAAKNGITVPRMLMETIRLRGGPVEPLLSWRNARRFGESANWQKVQLTWVENDNNVDSSPDGDPHERWEGVIASGTDQFPQVGGPPVGPFNNRYEADLDNSGKMKLYYSPEDHRIHLFGADTAWLKVDYNYDGKVDMEFRYRDTDHDGVIDTWEVDADGDGVPDRTVHLPHPHSQPVPLNYKSLTTFYNQTLDESLSSNQILIDELKAALQTLETNFKPDEIESYYTNDLANYRKEAGVGRKIRKSRAGIRYYQDLIRERYFCRLRKALSGRVEFWKHLEANYDAGQFTQTAAVLSKEFARRAMQTSDWPDGFTKRLPIHVLNSVSSTRLDEPVSLDFSAIRKQAADFNPRNFMVVTGARWIATHELPSQADDREIVFLADLRASQNSDYWIYYSPTGERPNSYPFKTVAASQAYGLTIWEAGKPYPIYTAEETNFKHRIVANGPVRTTLQADFDNFQTERNRYDIHQRFSIYANGRYSENSLTFHPAKPEPSVRFSLGFPNLPRGEYFFDKANGYWGSWGDQSSLAAIFGKQRALLQQNTKQSEIDFAIRPAETFTYYLVRDSRRDRMFPVAPNIANWKQETRTLAGRLHTPPQVRIGNAESR